jgi:dienelactone hydrolase
MKLRVSAVIFFLIVASTSRADGPADNVADNVRRIPALGIEVPESVRQELTPKLADLRQAIEGLRSGKPSVRVIELLPDVEIFHRAVHDALVHREFFNEKELPVARELLEKGFERTRQLAAGEAPWTSQTGLVVRGYVSRIDGSVQPYGLVVPESYEARGAQRHRLDLWFHGRGENLSELNFLAGRLKDRGIFAPPDTIVLHPYGRYCNAFKFAGETDVLEALEAVRQRYRIDDDRIAARGFSMGGAACWQFAVHFADRWVGATPGAGFSETPEFLKVFQKEAVAPTWWEKRLWHWYDCTDWAVNLLHCPTIAYSGEIDSQKQAADMMAEALRNEGIELVHIIGPKTAHAYHPEARIEIDRRLSSIAARGRERIPRFVHLVTYTLKYNQMAWVTVDGLDEHWSRARVSAEIVGDGAITVKSENVQALTLSFPPGWAPFDLTQPVSVSINGQDLRGPRPESDRSFTCSLYRQEDKWTVGTEPVAGMRKRHDLQGPIDDAFMDAFVFVRPTGKASNSALESWTRAEFDRAVDHWRRQFRGEARVKDDTSIGEDEIASANLVLWGDPASNAVLKRIIDRLPIGWSADEIKVGQRRYPAGQHALALVYPNPLNPRRYVVLNSSFTFRDYDYLNNARQVAKLPDWAIIDLRTAPNSRFPGKIVDADFFDEQWKLKSPHEEAAQTASQRP